MTKREWWNTLDDAEKQAFRELNEIFNIEFVRAKLKGEQNG
jgi:hypothetical protein